MKYAINHLCILIIASYRELCVELRKDFFDVDSYPGRDLCCDILSEQSIHAAETGFNKVIVPIGAPLNTSSSQGLVMNKSH